MHTEILKYIMSTHIILLFIIHLTATQRVCSIQNQIVNEKLNDLEQTNPHLSQGNKKITPKYITACL